jgi:transposase
MAKAPTRLRRTFSPQFKKDAVRLVTEEGKSLTEVATHLVGIARSLLQRWREQAVSKPAAEVFRGHGRVIRQAEKIRELEKKLRDVTMERDILKSAGLLCGRAEVKFRFIQAQQETFPVGSSAGRDPRAWVCASVAAALVREGFCHGDAGEDLRHRMPSRRQP